MKVVIKNFLRNAAANLTIRSVKHFMSDAEIYAMSLYVKTPEEYRAQPALDVLKENQFFMPTKYFNLGPSVGNSVNNLFFSEPYNFIFKVFEHSNEKILMLAEDHFFTTGQTLKELAEQDFDVGYAKWDGSGDEGANGSMLCIVPSKVGKMFPIPESRTTVEHVLLGAIKNVPIERRYSVSTRDAIDYKDDGFYTNSVMEIETALKLKGIV